MQLTHPQHPSSAPASASGQQAVTRRRWLDWLGAALVLGLSLYLVYLYLPASLAPPQVVSPPPVPRASEQPAGPAAERPSAPSATPTPSLATAEDRLSRAGRLLDQLDQLQQQPDWTRLADDPVQMQAALQQLSAQGRAALPAIRHYLNASLIEGAAVGTAGQVNLRLALFELLGQIGGAEAENILYQQMSASSSPVEIELLGQQLEQLTPGLYSLDILERARQRLDQVRSDPSRRQDVGPLFRLLGRYGDAELVADLESLSQLRWGQYGAITLARLPDGAGLASLARWVEEGPSGNTSAEFALNILAQSADDPVAGQTLLQAVRNGAIRTQQWSQLAQLLAGTYHLQLEPPESGLYRGRAEAQPPVSVLHSRRYTSLTPAGPQVVYGVQTAEPALTPEQIDARLELIDRLLAETADPAARRALIQAENLLWSRFQQHQEP